MHIYDTLIIGSGYVSGGFAIAKENCIICERTELCDAFFGAAIPYFEYKLFLPKESESTELAGVFDKHKIYNSGMINAFALECAFCSYLADKNIDISLKTRVVSVEEYDGCYKAMLISNGGLETVYARNIKDFSCKGSDYLTVIVESNNISDDYTEINHVFGNVLLQSAFYPHRYALRINSNGKDINNLKLDIFSKWENSDISAKILHVPSAMFSITDNQDCDSSFVSPIHAFEHGIHLAKEDNR